MAGEPIKKISVLNDELDVKLFIYIAKRNILFPIAFIAMALAGSWLYLRYTPPVFQTSAILQLGGENQANRFLSTVNIYEDDMAKQIELVRSSVFQHRALSNLPLNISYFTKGRVLNNELYKNAPFRVEARAKNSALYGIPINIDFIDQSNVMISYTINGQGQQRREFASGRMTSLPDLDIMVEVLNPSIYEEQQSVFTRNPYFFVINNPETAISRYSPDIKINVLNASARTILISNTGTNAQKASDIVNAMAEEFNVFDLEKKAESANNILEFIDRQLDVVFDQLAEYPIYIFKANYSKRVFIQNVNRLVSESNISKLSIVLNAVDREYSSYGYDKGYAYGYYGGYGYGYYEESMSSSSKGLSLFKPITKRFKKWFK
jgi:hypothetical protein